MNKITHRDSCQVVCFFIGPGGYRLLQHADNKRYKSFITRQFVSSLRNAASGRMVTDFVMYDHRRGPVWSPKGSLLLILPGRAGPLPLTGPRMAMPFDRHTCHGLFFAPNSRLCQCTTMLQSMLRERREAELKTRIAEHLSG